MTALDAAQTMPDADQETTNHHFANDRWYTPLPTLHVSQTGHVVQDSRLNLAKLVCSL